MNNLFKLIFSISVLITFSEKAVASNPNTPETRNEIPTQGPTIHKLQMDCDSSKLLAINETISNGPPMFSALFFTLHGGKLSTIDLTEQLQDIISDSYDVKRIELGCLEDKHGHGIKIPSHNPETEPLHIQITTEGRVFEGYDHAGYNMLEGKKLVQF